METRVYLGSKSSKLEFGLDPTCNPYLSLALVLSAGLEGITNRLTAPDSLCKNAFHLHPDEVKSMDRLSSTLHESLMEIKKILLLNKF